MDDFDKKLFTMARAEDACAPADLNARVRRAFDGLPERGGAGLGRTARVALCALAAATVLAVFSAGGFKAVELWRGGDTDEDNYTWYGVKGGEYRYIPVEELSETVREIAGRNPVADTTRDFKGQDWSAAQELSGVTLPANSALEGMEMGSSYLTVSANENGPTRLRFWQGTPGLWLTVSADAYTQLMSGGGINVSRGFDPELELSAREYTTVKGLSALIVHLEPGEDAGGAERYMADLMVDGFMYHIKVEVDGTVIKTGGEALETLYRVLDGFAG